MRDQRMKTHDYSFGVTAVIHRGKTVDLASDLSFTSLSIMVAATTLKVGVLGKFLY